MMPLALDPSETRTRPGREARSWIVVSVQAVVGLGMFAGCACGVYALASGGAERVSDVRFTKVDDWPEIKDGVPVAVPAKAKASATALAAAQPTAPPSPAPVALASPMSASLAPGEAMAPSRTLPPAPIERTPALPSVASVPVPTPRPGIDPLIDADRKAATTASTAPAAPLPPRKPAPSEEARVKPAEEARPKRVAAVPPAQRPPMQITRDRSAEAPAGTPAAAPKPAETEPAADDDHVSVLGMKVPTLSSTGRKIMRTVDDLGEAVRSLPGKL